MKSIGMVLRNLLNTVISKIQSGVLHVTVICVISVNVLESCIKCIYHKDIKISGNHGNHIVSQSDGLAFQDHSWRMAPV